MQIWQAEAHGTAFAHTEGLWCWADPSRQLSPTTDCSLPFSRTGRKEKKKKKNTLTHTHPTPKPTVQSNTCGLKYESTLIRKKKIECKGNGSPPPSPWATTPIPSFSGWVWGHMAHNTRRSAILAESPTAAGEASLLRPRGKQGRPWCCRAAFSNSSNRILYQRCLGHQWRTAYQTSCCREN